MSDSNKQETIREQVRDGYAKIAKVGAFTVETDEAPCCSGGCCGGASFDVKDLATSIGYSKGELAHVPESANMGLSCGNPTAIASLREGEVVLDLGSGGGFDVFVAGPKVGATGRVIGVDMTPEMISRARNGVATYREHTGLSNVEFRLGEIEHLPVADNSVDVVISNCVLNLSPDKGQVWREIARVLRPGGRAVISDLALLQPLPVEVTEMVTALVGCVAGAILISEVEKLIGAAGLTKVKLVTKPEYIDAMTTWQDPLYQKILAALPENAKVSDFVTSLDVEAWKG